MPGLLRQIQTSGPDGDPRVAGFPARGPPEGGSVFDVGWQSAQLLQTSIAGGSNQASSIHLEVGPCKIRGSWTDMGLCVRLLVQELDLMNQPTWQGLKGGKRGDRGGITEPDDD